MNISISDFETFPRTINGVDKVEYIYKGETKFAKNAIEAIEIPQNVQLIFHLKDGSTTEASANYSIVHIQP